MVDGSVIVVSMLSHTRDCEGKNEASDVSTGKICSKLEIVYDLIYKNNEAVDDDDMHRDHC